MRLRDTLLICAVAVSLGLAATLVVTRSGARGPADRVERTVVATDEAGRVPGAVDELSAPAVDSSDSARARATPVFDEGGIAPLDAERRREGRKREAAFLAEFLALRTEQGSEVFERTVHDVLSSKREPQCRKVAGLRALHSAGVPGTDALLAAVVEGQADVSDGSSLSVPRYALKLLFERAPAGEDARRVLARLAFVQQAGVSADLRREASTALAGSIRGPRHDEVVRLLRLEATPAQLEAALEALSRDTNFGAAKSPLAALGAESGAAK